MKAESVAEIRRALIRRVHALASQEREEVKRISDELRKVLVSSTNSSVAVCSLRHLMQLLLPSISSDTVLAVAIIEAFPDSYMHWSKGRFKNDKWNKGQTLLFANIAMKDMKEISKLASEKITTARNEKQDHARYCLAIDWSQYPGERGIYEAYALLGEKPDYIASTQHHHPNRVRSIITAHNLRATGIN